MDEPARRYGYETTDVELRFYVGRFAVQSNGGHEAEIRRWCKRQRVGGKSIGVYSVHDVVRTVQQVAASTTYRDNPVLVTMKVLAAAGLLDDEVDTSGVHAEEAEPT